MASFVVQNKYYNLYAVFVLLIDERRSKNFATDVLIFNWNHVENRAINVSDFINFINNGYFTRVFLISSKILN
jgi:hypothetical protein